MPGSSLPLHDKTFTSLSPRRPLLGGRSASRKLGACLFGVFLCLLFYTETFPFDILQTSPLSAFLPHSTTTSIPTPPVAEFPDYTLSHDVPLDLPFEETIPIPEPKPKPKPKEKPHSPFIIPLNELNNEILPVPNPPKLDYPLTKPKEEGMVVPNIVHYIWLSPETGEKALELKFKHYMAIQSVLQRLKPDVFYIHCNIEPRGPWWDAVRHHFTINKLEMPETVFGIPIEETTHQTDILRVLILKELGGIYMDSDIFVVRNFDELMYDPYTIAVDYDPKVFWPSIQLAEPQTPFLEKFIQSYREYNPENWYTNCCQQLSEKARLHRSEVTLLRVEAFYAPGSWQNEIFETDSTYDFFATGQYTYHGWNHYTGWQNLEKLNPRDILERNSSMNRMLKDLVTSDDVALWDSLHQ